MFSQVSMLTTCTAIGLGLYYCKRYFNGGICSSEKRLDGKTAIITGATSGIGKETAKDLARRGARIILAVRNLEKAEVVVKELEAIAGVANVWAIKLDVSSIQSVKDFAKEFKNTKYRLDILVNNAGIGYSEESHTNDGIESFFQTNYLGHFLLTMLLEDELKKSAPSRVINVSSMVYKNAKTLNLNDLRNKTVKFHVDTAYAQSKLAQVISTRKLAKYFDKQGVTVYSLHPGIVRSSIFDNVPYDVRGSITHFLQYFIFPYFAKNEVQGAQTSIYCAVEEGIEEHSGCYFSDCRLKKLAPQAMDDAMAEQLWNTSWEMISDSSKNDVDHSCCSDISIVISKVLRID